MRLILFTPWSIKSAAANISRILVEQLIEMGHEVLVVKADEELLFADEITSHCEIQTVSWDDNKKIQLNVSGADMVVYQLGSDQFSYFGCLEWLPKLPGVVCLLDCTEVGNIDMLINNRVGIMALGVVANSNTNIGKLSTICSGPICVLPPANQEGLINYAGHIVDLIMKVAQAQPLIGAVDFFVHMLNKWDNKSHAVLDKILEPIKILTDKLL